MRNITSGLNEITPQEDKFKMNADDDKISQRKSNDSTII
jgi:hypothetical protein